jgi:hypothetical protein
MSALHESTESQQKKEGEEAEGTREEFFMKRRNFLFSLLKEELRPFVACVNHHVGVVVGVAGVAGCSCCPDSATGG